MEPSVVERFGEQKVKDRAVLILVDGALEERMRALQTSSRLFRDAALYQRFQIVRIGAQTLLELLQSTLESAAFTVGDLEISAGNTHALVQRQCAREGDDRFLGQAFAEIEDAKVVVRAGVRGIYSTGE